MQNNGKKLNIRGIMVMGIVMVGLGLFDSFSLDGSSFRAFASSLQVLLGFFFIIAAKVDKARDEILELKNRITELERK